MVITFFLILFFHTENVCGQTQTRAQLPYITTYIALCRSSVSASSILLFKIK